MSRIKVSSAKQKARKLQQKVRDKVQELYGLSENDVRSTPMGSSGIDVQLSDLAREAWPYACECKARATMSIYNDWAQCSANADREKLTPLLVLKADRKEVLAVIRLDKFFEIINE